MLRAELVKKSGLFKDEVLKQVRAAKPKMLLKLGQEGQRAVRANFTEEVDPAGKAWEPSIRARLEGGKTLRQKGDLYRSIDFAVLSDGVAVVFVNPLKHPGIMKYAMLHNFGGTITPKRRKYLTIPVHRLARGKTVEQMRSVFKSVFLLPRKGKTPVIMGTNGGKPVLLYVLKKSVTIPKREFMGFRPSWRTQMTEKALAILKGGY